MTEEAAYGNQFIDRLRALSRQSQFNYRDLQAIKAMSQQELAAKLSAECRRAGEIVLQNTAEDAAQLVLEKQREAMRSNATASKIEGSVYLLEVIAHLWSFVH